ncbi:hypothetical protein ALC62_05091, partial [Cyphomyrmex costatus]
RKTKIMHVSVESGQPWSRGRKEKKDGKKECRRFTVMKYRRTRACVAPKSCRRQSRVRNGRNRRGRTRQRRKSYLHQDSARLSSYHTSEQHEFVLLASPEATNELKDI